MRRKLVSLIILCCASLPALGVAVVSKIKVQSFPDKTRFQISLSKNAEHQIYYNQETRQNILKLKNSKTIIKVRRKINNTQVREINAEQKAKDLFIAFVVLERYRIKSFVVKPSKTNKNHLLIIDFYFNQKPKKVTVASNMLDILIDPGHGGEDPGAIGILGTKEKIVTLSVAKKLYKLISAEPNMQAHLTRRSDKYLSLKNRSIISRELKADLFISIHADKYQDPTVSGVGVYVLANRKGSSKMSAWLEKLEIDSDFLADKQTRYYSDDKVEKVLLDLANKANKKHSVGLAKNIFNDLKINFDSHYGQVQKANFFVLKNSGVPSLLVEVGFISNAAEEMKLLSPQYQQKLANVIFNSIKKYIKSL